MKDFNNKLDPKYSEITHKFQFLDSLKLTKEDINILDTLINYVDTTLNLMCTHYIKIREKEEQVLNINAIDEDNMDEKEINYIYSPEAYFNPKDTNEIKISKLIKVIGSSNDSQGFKLSKNQRAKRNLRLKEYINKLRKENN